ncbi:hypothetical protein SASPL_106937 [Salvia splendens]|uniref:Protein kinase domain-containing protein n=1 Tax=Salvia splendens TaxID=180675 RepID=A0A8X8YFW1_SALSN|nr:hypothetical protein SASPL_106937 [Salvia splendens]
MLVVCNWFYWNVEFCSQIQIVGKSFLLGDMELLLSFVILCAFLFQESAGLCLLPIKVEPLDLSLYGGRSRLLFQLNVPHPKTFRFRNADVSSTLSDSMPPLPVSAHHKHHLRKKNHHISLAPHQGPAISPTVSPTSSPSASSRKSLPPLPPNKGCVSVACTEPLTFTPPGTTCACVWPIQVRLQFSISLYVFFPMVSELGQQIAEAVPLNQTQVRIVGADAADPELEKTTVLINLVPLAEAFTSAAAFSIYKKFWSKELSINTSTFGVYDVLYVHYPGLPPSPPAWPSGSATIDVQPYPRSTSGNDPIKPFGADVPRGRRNESSRNMIIIIVLSSVTAFVVCMGFMLLVLSKWRDSARQGLMPQEGKESGGGRLLKVTSRPSSASVSFSSSLMVFTGTAKVFSIEDMERATDSFDSSRIVGEGGFGLVYGGTLDDGRKVAVKVLKRDDQQGGREFLAEVEMLGRLHHRNLVKLIGICPDEHSRCLVYELVPNGSVESHLHGVDKEIAPLDCTQARFDSCHGNVRAIIDPSLKSAVPLENVARVAAIASMCVQPEVSHRPFMGEVVQALKLVCNELDETREPASRNVSRDDFSIEVDEQLEQSLGAEITLSGVDLSSSSAALRVRESESFRRQFNSAPLKVERKRKFWQRLRGLSGGSMSEHEYSLQP